MAQASKKTRQIRKLKRQRTILLRMAEVALNERDFARALAKGAIKEVENLRKQLEPDTTISKVEDESDTVIEQGDQTNRPEQDSPGLEVSES